MPATKPSETNVHPLALVQALVHQILIHESLVYWVALRKSTISTKSGEFKDRHVLEQQGL